MLSRTIKTISILSLDVAAGACLSALFVAQLLGVAVSYWSLMALFIAVWLIYTTDHLMDARRIAHIAHTARHRFHQRNSRLLLIITAAVMLLGLYVLFQLDTELLIWGVVLLALVGLYFVLIRFFRLKGLMHKEIIIALLYPAGIFLAPMQQLSHIPMLAISLFLMFTLLALSNLLLISIYEQDSDRQDGHRSFVLSYGLHRSRQVINCALVAFYSCLLLTYLCMPSLGLFAMIILLLMGLGLHLIKAKPALFQKNDKYRVLADMIFLLPAIYLLLS